MARASRDPLRLTTLNRLAQSIERVSAAYSKANSVLTRASSVAAAEFLATDECSGEDEWKSLAPRLEKLCEQLEAWGDDERMQDGLDGRRVKLTAAIMATAPPSFFASIEGLFSAALRARHARWKADQRERGEMQDDDSYGSDPSHEDVHFPLDEVTLYSNLRFLGWIGNASNAPRFVQKALHSAMRQVIDNTVSSIVSGEYDTYGILDSLHHWKDQVLKPWIMHVVLDSEDKNTAFPGEDTNMQAKDAVLGKIDFAVAESFVRHREHEIFDIVADYPDSHPAVEELRKALNITRIHRTRMADSLRNSLQRRLLHPGANTSQILDVYISTIKVLRVIDPTDGLLGYVADPVRKYLQGRGDTVRCIITGLTDEESGGDLYDELRRQDARPLEQVPDSDDEEDIPSPDWQPAVSPHQQSLAAPHTSALDYNKHEDFVNADNHQASDILAMLVGIYGSQELFVNEYRIMLADKLLANLTFDTDREVHTLELLKLRFGEASMRQCEIMIKDIDDSKRIVSNIHSTLKARAATAAVEDRRSRQRKHKSNLRRQQLTGGNLSSAMDFIEVEEEGYEIAAPATPVVDAAIISHIFWPSLLKDGVKTHPRIQHQLDQFSKEYANLKNPRRLLWLGQLGAVELELEVDESGETKSFSCSPLHATLIYHFEDDDTWTATDLANETGVSEDIIRRKMGYWISNHVVRCVPQENGTLVYQLASSDDMSSPQSIDDTAAAASMRSMGHVDDEDDDGQISRSAAAGGFRDAEEIKLYESYIVGMLTNLGQLPLERIHNMLKMFVTGSDHKYDKTPQQLSGFLQHLCKEETLECGPDGMYKLSKK